MSSPDNWFDIFCICQESPLKEEVKQYFLRDPLKESREIPTNATLEQVRDYLLPDYVEMFDVDSINVGYFYRIYYNPENMLREIEQLSQKITLTKDISDYLDSMKKSASRLLEKQRKTEADRLVVSIRLQSHEGYFNQSDIERIWKNEKITSIFETQERLSVEAQRGSICSRVRYGKDYSMIGDVLPRSLPLPKEIESKVGQTTINGLVLSFEDSPIGLESLEIGKEDEMWKLHFHTMFKAKRLRDFYPEGCEFIISISKFFMEERK